MTHANDGLPGEPPASDGGTAPHDEVIASLISYGVIAGDGTVLDPVALARAVRLAAVNPSDTLDQRTSQHDDVLASLHSLGVVTDDDDPPTETIALTRAVGLTSVRPRPANENHGHPDGVLASLRSLGVITDDDPPTETIALARAVGLAAVRAASVEAAPMVRSTASPAADPAPAPAAALPIPVSSTETARPVATLPVAAPATQLIKIEIIGTAGWSDLRAFEAKHGPLVAQINGRSAIVEDRSITNCQIRYFSVPADSGLPQQSKAKSVTIRLRVRKATQAAGSLFIGGVEQATTKLVAPMLPGHLIEALKQWPTN